MCCQDGHEGEFVYTEEQKLVIEKFRKGFCTYKDTPIVLYGLGKNTEAVLEAFRDFRFEGLMDGRRTGEDCFGYRVLSEEEVKEIHPIIVIIARDSVQGIIYGRISHLYGEEGIRIFSYQGTELTGRDYEYSNESLPYWDSGEMSLKQAIREAEVVSFDIFDTLVMRRVLEPEDIFYLTERRWNAGRETSEKLPFHDLRIKAERSLAGCPKIEDIYTYMGKICKISGEELNGLLTMEIRTEQDCLICREPVLGLMKYAMELGKPVYLLSDMYYSSKQLEELLKPLGIEGYERIFVSCEVGKDKESGGLYDVYRKYIGQKAALHIGDNRRADIGQAGEKGFFTYHIYSGEELLAASNLQELLTDVKDIQQRLLLGLFTVKAFQDPFVLCRTKGRVKVKSLFETGYLFFGPILAEIAVWLKKEVEESAVDQLLFPSRDGYLMEKLYQLLCEFQVTPKEGRNHCVPSVYFRTSRRASSVAAIRTEEDICFLLKRKFDGTKEELLWQRFGIHPSEESLRDEDMGQEGLTTEKYILAHSREILRNAQKERELYLGYLKKKGIGGDKKEAIFDFVAGGTVQYYLEKLTGKKMKGVYAATSNLPNDLYRPGENICAAYGNFNTYGAAYALAKYYLLLEPVMMDEQSTFRRMNENGQEEYCGRTNSCSEEIGRIQEGILAFAKDWYALRALSGNWDNCLQKADDILGMLFTRCQVSDEIKKVFRNDDEYDGIKQYIVWEEKA